MAAPRNRKHLLVRTPPSTEAYTPHPKKIEPPPIPPPRNRRQHAATLRAALQQAERETAQEREELGITVHGAEPGLYIQFESAPGVELKLDSLEDKRKGIELVAVQTAARPGQPPIQLATVFVPDGELPHFATRFQQYAVEKRRWPPRKPRSPPSACEPALVSWADGRSSVNRGARAPRAWSPGATCARGSPLAASGRASKQSVGTANSCPLIAMPAPAGSAAPRPRSPLALTGSGDSRTFRSQADLHRRQPAPL
jgi:hypothetical protein